MPNKAYSADHQWVGAANVDIPANIVGQANARGTLRVAVETKVDILLVSCAQCRRPYDAVAGEPCVAATAEGREHLIGGPTGERAKRTHPWHDCETAQCDLSTSVARATNEQRRRTG